jgi:hypothetical protein
MKRGRPSKSKLDQHEVVIFRMSSEGLSSSDVAEWLWLANQLRVSPARVRQFINERLKLKDTK